MDENRNKQQRRQPGANAKRPPQKAPHAKPRKHVTPAQEPERRQPEVVYMAPKPFSRNRLILQLTTVAAVVMAILLGLSIFFRVEHIQVSGCDRYTAWDVQQASGIQEGDQLLTFSVPKASAKIINALPYVKSVRIGISLPDTVRIEIVETRVTYALQDSAGSWWLMDSDGKLLEQCSESQAQKHTVIRGVQIAPPTVGESAVAYEPTQTQTDPSGNPIPVTVSAGQRLDAAKAIAENLEAQGILGDVVYMDVTNISELVLQYTDKLYVQLGDTEQIDLKIAYLRGVLEEHTQTKPYERGELDLSDLNRVVYESLPD